MKKRILIITYYWPPAGGAGVQRWLKMSQYLPQHVIEPIILTVDPESASYPVKDESFLKEIPKELRVIRTKSFEPLKLYEKIAGKENVPYSGFANVDTNNLSSKAARWIRGNFFIPDARKGWNRYALPEALKLIRKGEVDLVITTGPPHSTHLIGQGLKRETGIPWIADFRDPWTDIYYYDHLKHSAPARKRDARLELDVLKECDAILSVCPSNQGLLAEKLPIPERSKVVLITNGYDPKDFESRTSQKRDEIFTLVYTGTIAPNYEVDPLITGLKNLRFPWKWLIAGEVAPEVKEKFSAAGIASHLDYRGYVSHNEVLDILVSADLLIHLLPRGFKATSGKLFEYIGSGKPVLNIGNPDGDSAAFLKKAGAGKTFSSGEEKALTHFIDEVREQNSPVSGDRRIFSRPVITEKLAEFLKRF